MNCLPTEREGKGKTQGNVGEGKREHLKGKDMAGIHRKEKRWKRGERMLTGEKG